MPLPDCFVEVGGKIDIERKPRSPDNMASREKILVTGKAAGTERERNGRCVLYRECVGTVIVSVWRKGAALGCPIH